VYYATSQRSCAVRLNAFQGAYKTPQPTSEGPPLYETGIAVGSERKMINDNACGTPRQHLPSTKNVRPHANLPVAAAPQQL
jgi:hypothetical protein